MDEKTFIKKYQPCMDVLLKERIKNYRKIGINKTDMNLKSRMYTEYYNNCLKDYVDHLNTFTNTIIDGKSYVALVKYAGAEDIFLNDLGGIVGCKIRSKQVSNRDLLNYYVIEKCI